MNDDPEFSSKQRLVKRFTNSLELPKLLAASVEANHTLYITPCGAVITSPNKKCLAVEFSPSTKAAILQQLLIEMLWETYREG